MVVRSPLTLGLKNGPNSVQAQFKIQRNSGSGSVEQRGSEGLQGPGGTLSHPNDC